jgi:hypothetical protein
MPSISSKDSELSEEMIKMFTGQYTENGRWTQSDGLKDNDLWLFK